MVWEEEIEPLLQGEAADRLRTTTIIEWLKKRSDGWEYSWEYPELDRDRGPTLRNRRITCPGKRRRLTPLSAAC